MNHPPMHEQHCGNCRYATELGSADDAISCRRHAPRIVPELLAKDDPYDPFAWGSWPVVPIGQWCGEWCGR
jgi:hypothetical protein